MRKFTFLLVLLATVLTTATAQIGYGKRLWTFPATNHERVTEVPEEIFTDFAENYSSDNRTLTNEKVGVYVAEIRVHTAGNVATTITFNAGNIRMDISGVDILNENGEVVKSDYHFGYAGGNHSENTYTLEGVEAGDYHLRIFIAAQKEDITPETSNDSKGNISVTGAYIYPQASTAENKTFYYIKNVRSNKYANYEGAGVQFTQKSSTTYGSYWYFAEVEGETNIPEGYKAYRLYNAANTLAVENPSNGYMSQNEGVTYPAKIYYVGVHNNGNYTNFVIRPNNEDAASWNDAGGNGQKIGVYSYDDPGSIWAFEQLYTTEEELINQAVPLKNNALASLNDFATNGFYNYITPEQQTNAIAEIEGIDISTLEAALTSAISNVFNTTLQSYIDAHKTATPAAGDRFMMKNKGRDGYLRAYAADENVKCSSLDADLFALDLVWTLVATDNEAEFKIYNERLGVYLGALSTSNNTTFKYTANADDAGVYEITSNGAYSLFHAVGQDDKGYLHKSNWTGQEIVRWDNGDPSQWILQKAPFELTTDKENPICYAIRSGRGNYYFTLENNKIKLYNNKDIVTDNATHWFFMLDEDKNLQIYPLNDKENPMGYITVEDGAGKLTNNSSTEGYADDAYTLYFGGYNAQNFNSAYFAFKPISGTTFVSNHGGTGNYMGFYNNYNDAGTRVDFENIAYVTLNKKYETLGNQTGEGLGQYTTNDADAMADAMAQALTVIDNKASQNEEYSNALNALNSLSLTLNMPADGTYMRIQSAKHNTYLSSVNSTSNTSRAAFVTDADASTVFYYKDGKLLAVNTASYLGYTDVTDNRPFAYYRPDNAATEVQFTTAATGAAGQYSIKYNKNSDGTYNRWLYGQYKNNAYYTDAASDLATTTDKGYDFNLVALTDDEVAALPSFEVNVSAAGYATMFLDYAANIPAEAEVYVATKAENDYVTLEQVTGVLPANTGVIIKAEEGRYTFTSPTSGRATITSNMLSGSATQVDITPAENTTYYILAMGSKGIGLYPDALEGGTFRNNANKAYLPIVTAAGAAQSTGYRFDFEGTTNIEEIESETEKNVIYDLTGRRVETPAKGIYIINGKKVLVK